jgi:hypothetical protein
MFIRKITTRNKSTDESYFAFRLVTSERTAKQVRQITLLNLGRHFDLPKATGCASAAGSMHSSPGKPACCQNHRPSKPWPNAPRSVGVDAAPRRLQLSYPQSSWPGRRAGHPGNPHPPPAWKCRQPQPRIRQSRTPLRRTSEGPPTVHPRPGSRNPARTENRASHRPDPRHRQHRTGHQGQRRDLDPSL